MYSILLTRYDFVLLLKTVPEQLASSSCANEYLIKHSREVQMSNTTNNSVETILMQFFHWLFPSRKQLDMHIRLMLTYRKKSQEEERWRQRLSRSLQASQRLYWGCHKKYDDLLKKVAGYDQEIETLGKSLIKVHQNEQKALDEVAAVKEENRQLLLNVVGLEKMIAGQKSIIADKAKFIAYLWMRIPLP